MTEELWETDKNRTFAGSTKQKNRKKVEDIRETWEISGVRNKYVLMFNEHLKLKYEQQVTLTYPLKK